MNNLKEYRLKKELSQQEVADKLKISVRQYQNYEADIAEPKYRQAKKLAKILGVKADKLFP